MDDRVVARIGLQPCYAFIVVILVVIMGFEGNSSLLFTMEPLSVHTKSLPLEVRVTPRSRLCKSQAAIEMRMHAGAVPS